MVTAVCQTEKIKNKDNEQLIMKNCGKLKLFIDYKGV